MRGQLARPVLRGAQVSNDLRLLDCWECGAEHDRDVCAAGNIRFVGLRKQASVRGNELWHDMIPVEPDLPVRVRYGWGACYATA
jgi:transposase